MKTEKKKDVEMSHMCYVVDPFSSIAPLLLSAVLKADGSTLICADSSTPKGCPAHPWTKHTHHSPQPPLGNIHTPGLTAPSHLDHISWRARDRGKEREQSNLQTLRGERNSCWTLHRVDVEFMEFTIMVYKFQIS